MLLRTWEEIAQHWGCHKKTAMRKKAALLKARAIFYKKVGRPPRWIVHSHTEVLDRFIYGA